MLLGAQTTEFHMKAILPIASYTNGVSFPIQFAYRPKATPFAGEPCETNHYLVRMETCWKTRGTVLLHCLQPSCKFQHGTMCFGALRGCFLVSTARALLHAKLIANLVPDSSTQDRSHQIWSDQVDSARATMLYPRGGWG